MMTKELVTYRVEVKNYDRGGWDIIKVRNWSTPTATLLTKEEAEWIESIALALSASCITTRIVKDKEG